MLGYFVFTIKNFKVVLNLKKQCLIKVAEDTLDKSGPPQNK